MNFNQNIISADIVLFTGAGASRPLDKLIMDEFLNKILDNDNFFSAARPFADQDIQLIDQIANSLQSKKAAVDVDLETILSTLEDMHSLDDVLGYSKNLQVYKDRQNHKGCLYHTITGLRERIILHYSNINPKDAYNLYNPLWDNLFEFAKRKQCIPIFTTNYDPIFEEISNDSGKHSYVIEAAVDFSTPRNIVDFRRYSDFTPDQNAINLVVFHLHGCACWAYEKVRQETMYTHTPVHDTLRTGLENIIIYPTADKVPYIQPFELAYDYLQRCLDNAKIAIFIGYSFRDRDTLARVKCAMRWNEDLQLIIIDPRAENIAERYFPGRHKRVYAISKEFHSENLEYLQYLTQFLCESAKDICKIHFSGDQMVTGKRHICEK